MKKIYKIEVSSYGEPLYEYFYTDEEKAKLHFNTIKNVGRSAFNVAFHAIPTCDDIPIEEIKGSVEEWVL